MYKFNNKIVSFCGDSVTIRLELCGFMFGTRSIDDFLPDNVDGPRIYKIDDDGGGEFILYENGRCELKTNRYSAPEQGYLEKIVTDGGMSE